MNYLLFFIYLIIGCYLMSGSSFVKKTGLSRSNIILLYLLKISVSVLLGWITITLAPGANDYWFNNKMGIPEHELLLKDPLHFFTSIGDSNYGEYGNYFGSVHSYWNDLEVNLLIKIIAIMGFFSRGNYFINSIFFASFGFIGHIALYRLFKAAFPGRELPLLVGSFLLPSTLYFTSGIHKDSLLFMFIGIYCYSLYFSMTDKINWHRLTGLFISFLGVLLFRNYTAVLLLPASFAFALCYRLSIRPWKVFAATYILCLTLIVLGQSFTEHFRPLQLIVQKRTDFDSLGITKSQLPHMKLRPTVASFIQNAPAALNHVLLRPYFVGRPYGFSTILSFEIMVYFALVVFLGLKILTKSTPLSPILCFALFFAFSALLIIGYIVPNTGSIARYRSIFIPFLVVPALLYLHPLSGNIKIKNI